MARRPTRARYRSSSRYSAPRRSYRAAPRRRSSRRAGRSSGGARTIKLVIQTTSSPVVDMPLGMKPAPAPRRAKF